ncbi:microtubule-associated protein 2 isoform X2 [Cylas formicarius]|uniref:microtubule-associated protein 2 isoform X2 n=1 Tax=Cylas formicarius TaxID=197179 RepID=UPI00295855B0|nr:microtubule-associated protein 2 isoform X2 [Cylas formicarius]
MSQQIVNGPSGDDRRIIDEDVITKHSPKQPSINYDASDNPPQSPRGPQQPPGAGQVFNRPPLNRLDSRSGLFRPPFPHVQPPRLPQQPPRQQFVQRGPPPGPGGPQRPPVLVSTFPNVLDKLINSCNNQAPSGAPVYPQARPNFRPPFPRSPLPNQRPPIFQQRSLPAALGPRPFFGEESLYRSQTLDSSEIELSRNVENARGPPAEPRPPSIASNRSYSVPSPNPLPTFRRSGSSDSLEASRRGSAESVGKKGDEESSRPSSRMDRIVENGDKTADQPDNHAQSYPIINKEVERDSSPANPIITKEANSPVVIKGEQQEKDDEMEKLRDVAKANEEERKIAEDNARKENAKKDMNLQLVSKIKKEGDDSGVDESTQGNDQSSNGDARSPRKSSKSRTSSTTPTKSSRSLSRSSKAPSLQSPDSTVTTPGSADKKKVPMNKIQVGSAPSPNLKVVRSKIGSLDNASYKPGGGKVKIENKKLDFKHAGPRIEAKNEKYVPKAGEKKILHQKLQWNAKSKIGSLDNAAYKPKGGDRKIETVRLDFKEKAKPKVGSKDNIKHIAGGGDVKIENKKLDIHATSKVGSLDNVKHKPGGGEKKIFDDKEYLKHKSERSSMEHSLSGSQEAEHNATAYTDFASLQYEPITSARRRTLEMVQEERYLSSGRFSRTGSVRSRKSAKDTPRPQWRI